MRGLSIAVIAVLFIAGCDVPGRLVINNRSGADAVYTCAMKTAGGGTQPVIFRLKPDKPGNTLTQLFGFGQSWTDKRIQEYVDSIQFIEIRTKTDSTRLSDKKACSIFSGAADRG